MPGRVRGHGVTALASLLALDLGSSNTVICDPSDGIVFDEPTLIAHDKRTGRVIGIGNEAKDVVGRVSGYVVVESPIQNGRIVSVNLLDSYLQALIRALSTRRFSRPKVVVAVPSSATMVEIRSLMASLKNSGVGDVEKLDSIIAAALGIGLDIYQPNGSMVVNLGAGTTLSGIIAFGGVVTDSHAFCGGQTLDHVIMDLLRYRLNISIDESIAEEIKLALARLTDDQPRYVSTFLGRDLAKGNPIEAQIDDGSIRDVIADPIKRIIDVVLDTLSHCPPELAQDLVVEGLHLCGGLAGLPGMADTLAKVAQIPVTTADEPRYCVARGLARFGATNKK